MNFVFDEFGDLDDQQVNWLRAHLRSQAIVESSVDELVDVGSLHEFLSSYDAMAKELECVAFSSNVKAALQAALSDVDRLSASCAALLQRWAIVYNMCQAGNSAESVVAVARLSAEEVISRGLDYCGERLLRQERSGHVLRAMKSFLDEGRSINPGSPQHEYIKEALAALSSYTREQVAAGVV